MRLGLVTLFTICSILLTELVFACDGAKNIRLSKPVTISAQERADFQAMPPLKVLALHAPPMARYDETTQTYSGVGIDILCFITQDLGLRFELPPGRDLTVAGKLQQIKSGQADIFIPLSYSEERAEHGLFTASYYKSYYAVIAHHERQLSVNRTADLANYQVGFIQGVAFQPLLEPVVPAAQLHAYNQTTSDGLFQDVLNGTIDLAVFNQHIFTEQRYQREYFDLDIVHTLYEHPRAYSYYFSKSPQNQRIIEVFNRYLAVIDVSASKLTNAQGERHFLERYMAQREQRIFLQTAIVGAILLTLIAYLGLFRYRRMSKLLARHNTDIQQHQQALQAANEKLQTLSQTDSLTGLSNRRHFDNMLSHEYARYLRTGSPLSLLIIDIDHFKQVNDRYGHAVGDDYLQAIARALKSSLTRSTDLIARYGGEEFTCLLSNMTSEGAYNVAQRIHLAVKNLALPNPLTNSQQLTISIGMATVIVGNPNIASFFEVADTQLYKAKLLGRNQICATVIDS